MKFGSLLRASADEVPELEPLWACYKQLKKHLKRFPKGSKSEGEATATERSGSEASALPSDGLGGSGPPPGDIQQQRQLEEVGTSAAAATAATPATTAAAAAAPAGQQGAGVGRGGDDCDAASEAQEREFVAALTADVQRFNDTFLEREEDCVIRLRGLQDAADAACSSSSSASLQPQHHEVAEALYRRALDFHGELLLGYHWSVLAYTALTKILKKHAKHTGRSLVLRGEEASSSGLADLLSQPFCSLEVMTDMLRDAEAVVAQMAGLLGLPYEPRAGARRGLSRLVTSHSMVGDAPQEAAVGFDRQRQVAEAAGEPTGAGMQAAPAAAVAAAGHKRLRDEPAEEEEEEDEAGGEGCAALAATRPCSMGLGGAGDGAGGGQQQQDSGASAGVALLLPAAEAAAGWQQTDSASGGSGVGALRGQDSASTASGSNILRQTRAALGLWEQLGSTAATPSTVFPCTVAGSTEIVARHQSATSTHNSKA